MCVSPSFVWVERGPKWDQQPVPCKKCWRCLSNRVNDFVGRSLCEAAFSDKVCAITLTYAPRDDLAERIITPSHFQDFIRALRRRGHKVRYMGVGEYGDLHGRVHFHALLFFKGKAPTIPHQKNHHIPEWPHGHVYADWNADEKSCRYVCKYLLKGEAGRYWFSLSKKPVIGWAFFEKKAERAASLLAFPSSFDYLPPGGSTERSYLMTGATRRDYLARVIDLMADQYKLDHGHLSEWVLRGVQKLERFQHLKEYEKLGPSHDVNMLLQRMDMERMTEKQAWRASRDDRDADLEKKRLDKFTERTAKMGLRYYNASLNAELRKWAENPTVRPREP